MQHVAASTVAVHGAPGMARDLVGHVLSAAGFRHRLLSAPERRAPGHAPVVVLVDPMPEHWADAAEAGRVVLMTVEPLDADAVAEAVLRGADAVLHASSSAEEVASVVNMVAAGGTVLNPVQVRAVAERARAERSSNDASLRLTGREVEILRAIEAGLSVKQTSRQLGIAEKTVENLQSRLYRKLGVRNRAQALWQAHALGLLASSSPN